MLVLRRSAVVRIASDVPDEWMQDEQSSVNVLYLLPERVSPKVVERFAVKPEHEEMRYSPGTLLSRVDRSFMGRSAYHKMMGTELASWVTIRNGNTARRLAELVQEP